MKAMRHFFSWAGTLGVLLCGSVCALQAQQFEVDTLHMSGDVYERINFVIMGDGYLDSQLEKFDQDAYRMQARILAEEPLKNYRDYVNVFAIRVPSEVEGAADDPSMPIGNYFGSTYNYAGIQRLLVPLNDGVIMNVLSDHTPWFTQAFMLVNDTRYGGSGGWVATSSTSIPATEIAYHEIGHSFAGLNDEYWAGAQYARENVNMTANNDPESVPWWRWIGDQQIGVYEYESPGNGWYRPANGCKMQILGAPFCAVCKEQFANTILSSVQFVPGWYPEKLSVGSIGEDPVEFGVHVLQTTSESMHTTWYVNDELVAQGDTMYSFNPLATPIGDHSVSATVQETTEMLRNNTYSWSVTWFVSTTVTDVREAQVQALRLELQETVVDRELVATLHGDSRGKARGVVVDLHGNVICEVDMSVGTAQHIELPSIAAGMYLLQVQSGQARVTSKFMVR